MKLALGDISNWVEAEPRQSAFVFCLLVYSAFHYSRGRKKPLRPTTEMTTVKFFFFGHIGSSLLRVVFL